MKRILIYIILFLFIFSAACEKQEQAEKVKINVDFSITTPVGEVISKNIEIYEDDTVLSVLKEICDENDIEYKITGFGAFSYLNSLAGYEEKGMGAESGWVYKVNGDSPTKGIGSYKLKDKDKIEIIFILKQEGW